MAEWFPDARSPSEQLFWFEDSGLFMAQRGAAPKRPKLIGTT